MLRSRKALAASLAVILMIGLAAYAQVVQPTRKPATCGRGAAGQGFADQKDSLLFDTADRREHFYRFVHLQRFLLPPNKREMERLAVLLGLTEEQKQGIRELYVQFRDTVKPILEQRGAATRELFGVLQGPSPSKGALESAANKVEQADRAILSAEFDFWLAFREVLNTQQQQALGQFIKQKSEREFTPPAWKPGRQAR